ncbi:putative signaling protein [biofilm metagenome]
MTINNQVTILSAQLRQLFSASKISISVSALLALILAYKQKEVIEPTVVYIWLGAILVLCIIRLRVSYAFAHVQATDEQSARLWLFRFRLGVVASGILWGSVGFLFYPDDDIPHQMFLIFMLAGLSAGSFISFAPDRISSGAFYALTLLPISVKLIISGTNISVSMGIAGILYFGYMMISSRVINQTLNDNTKLRINALSSEETIRVSEERYRLLLNHSPVGIFHYDATLTFTYCNERFAALLQKPVDALIGDDVQKCLDKPVLSTMIKTLSGEVCHYDGRNCIKAKPEMWVDITCAPSRDAASQIAGGIAIIRDVSESKLAEEMLRIGAIAFDTQTAMIVTKPNFEILRVNQAFTLLTGYRAQEIIGKTPELLSSGRHSNAFFQGILSSLKETGIWQGEIWNRRKSGLIDAEWVTISSVTRSDGKTTHYVVAFSDITENEDAVAEIHRLAYYDPLTHLPNRRLLQDKLEQELMATSRNGLHGAILFLDLDYFKALNDTRGHSAGDQLLIEVARRLCTENRSGDIVGRLGGDEFVVIANNLATDAQEAALIAQNIAEKLLVALALPYVFDDFDFNCSTSIGIRLFSDQENADELLRHADMAMYQAKAVGRNTLCFFDPEMESVIANRVGMEKDLRRALDDYQFILCYQPFVSAEQILGAEVLVCWQHPERGLILPQEFIQLAEATDLILPIGQWVLETACLQLKHWQNDPNTQHLQLAVNVSVRQFRLPNFVEIVGNVLDMNGINPNLLKLELTETMLLDNVNDTINKMHNLKKIGIRLALDDFGTGYSSLSYLTQLPLDELKIDQSFVSNINTKPENASIVQAIIGMAHNLGIHVIAEGVETEAQRAFLEQHGCHTYQGYLYSRPLTIDKFEKLLSKKMLEAS